MFNKEAALQTKQLKESYESSEPEISLQCISFVTDFY